jgi:putative transposase
VVKPASKKKIVKHFKKTYQFSERTSCDLVGISRTGFRYQAKPKGDQAIRKRLLELATKHPSYGYLFLHGLMKSEGLVCNKKRTYRIYTELGLQVRTKKRKKLIRPRMPMFVPNRPNVRWSMDFVSDQLANGRRFRVLNVIDDFTREMVGQLTAFSISGRQVGRFLSELIETRGKPGQVVCDNGTEFTSKAMFFWQQLTGVKLGFIQPGKPTQNAFIESLNGKFRSECLDQNWFKSIEQAIEKINQWRSHYNTVRPHSSLGYMTPVAFAEQAA